MMAARFEPGDLVRRFAAAHRWPIAERCIVVEGEHDQRYLALADQLYFEVVGLRLLGKRVSAFPTGIGDDGGAFGMQRHFHPLRANMDCDLTPEGRRVFHAIALFDDDMEGRRGFSALTGQHLNYRKWRDVFSLRRVLPRETRDPEQTSKFVDDANSAWKGMDCEIEDLVAAPLIDEFVRENPRAVRRAPERRAEGIHCFFERQAKSEFVRFVEKHAVFADMACVVEFLKSLRYFLGVPVDGD